MIKAGSKHLFIINPIAGKGQSMEFIPLIKKYFEGRETDFIIEITEYPGHATQIARNYVQQNDYRVYSIGGDGTLNEVLNGMVGCSSSLAVVPGGSGNDFFRSIAGNADQSNLLSRTIDGKEKPIDIVKVNERYFLNVTSIGFDAETVFHTRLVKRLPLISGSTAYIIGILMTIIKNKKYEVEINMGDSFLTEKILLAAIANGRFYGGGIKPAPQAEIDDGLLDICIVRSLGRLKILWLLPLYMKGKHSKIKEVSLLKARSLSITCQEGIPLNIDGEVSMTKSVSFEIMPKGIRIVIPEVI